MEIKNKSNISILDYLKTGNSEQSTSNTNTNFQDIFEQNRSTDATKYQSDSQKHYLKDRVSNSNEKPSKNIEKSKNSFDKKDSQIGNNTISSNEVDSSKTNEVDKTSKSEKTEKVEDKKETNKDELDSEKVKKLAKLLNVSEEQVVETLNAMNINIDDLANVEIAKDFLVAINDLGSKFDLLSIENVKQKLVAIDEIAKAETTEELSDEQIDSLINEALGLASENTETTSDSEFSQNSDNQTKSEVTASTTTSTVSNSDETDMFAEVEVSVDTTTDTSTEVTATSDVNVTENTAIVGSNVENVQTSNVQNTLVDANGININADFKVANQNSFLNEVSKTTLRSAVDAENVLKQISEAMKVEVKGDVTNEVKITLRPQHLGDVTLKIVTENGAITAQFEAQNQRVKEIIEANFNQLKSSLEEQGISVSNLEVNVSQQDQNNGASNEFSQNDGNRRNGTGTIGGDGIEGVDLSNEVILEESVAVGSRNSYKA